MSLLDFSLSHRRRDQFTALTCVLVALIGLADFWLGTSFSLEFFYLVPVALAVVARGRGFGVAVALASVFIWVGGDLAAGAQFSSWLVPAWNGAITLATYLVLIWLLGRLLDMKHELERRVEQRTRALAEEIAERERLERSILEISERERRNIGHDLHDGLGQHLTGTAITAQVLADTLAERHAAEADHARKIVTLVTSAIGQTRTMAKGLLLADIVPEGLPAALDELCADVSTQHRVSCRFRDESAQARLPSGAANHLFRIAQEAIRNGIRHGAANQLEVRLLLQNDRLVLSIRDNGSGLLPAGQRGLGLGLRIMAHRARMIGAAFTIEGRPGAGTVVSCTLPLSNHA
ncbi:MAG TPA: sensor histidine kinase [Lacunisphaera sp.]